MQKTNPFRNSKISAKQLALRKRLWPHIKPEDLWNRKVHQGFTTVPRTMPLILKVMDNMSNRAPVSSVYLDLWCRAFDECFVTLNKPQEMAFSSGFNGQRATQTWKKRIEILGKLGFIELAPGASGDKSYALLLNPHNVIQQHWKKKTTGFSLALHNALAERAVEIGANDLVSVEEPPEEKS